MDSQLVTSHAEVEDLRPPQEEPKPRFWANKKRAIGLVAALLVVGAVVGVVTSISSSSQVKQASMGASNLGMAVCYDTYQSHKIDEHFTKIASRFSGVRSFTTHIYNDNVIDAAARHELFVYAGIWVRGTDYSRDVQAAIDGSRRHGGIVKAVFVGNEDLSNGWNAGQLINTINDVRGRFQAAGLGNIPIGTVQIDGDLLKHPEVADVCDVLGVNIYPFFSGAPNSWGSNPISDMDNRWNAIYNKFGDKAVITETGWPFAGGNYGQHISSYANAINYFNAFRQWADGKGGALPAYFMFHDNPAKGGFEANFGVADNNANWKFDFSPLKPYAPQPNPTPVTPALNRYKLPFLLQSSTGNMIYEMNSGLFAYKEATCANERWRYNLGTNQIVSESNGKCIDAYNSNGQYYVHTWDCDSNNGNQKWNIDTTNNQIKHMTHNNLCLDIDPTKQDNSVQVWACTGGPNQKIMVNPDLPHVGIASHKTGHVLVGDNGATWFRQLDGSFKNVQADKAAVWTFVQSKNMLVHEQSGKCLDAYEAKNGGTVHLWDCNDSNGNQKWNYDPATLQIRHATYNSYCLDMASESGSNPYLWECHGDGDYWLPFQQFTFVIEIESGTLFMEVTRMLRVAFLEASNQIGCITTMAMSSNDKNVRWFVISKSETSAVTSYALLSKQRGVHLSPYMPQDEAISLGKFLAEHQFTSFEDIRGTESSVQAFLAGLNSSKQNKRAEVDGLYRLDRVKFPVNTRGTIKMAIESDIPLLTSWVIDFHQECFHHNFPFEAARSFVMTGISRQALFMWMVNGHPVGFGGYAPPVTTDHMTVYMLGPIFVSPSERSKGYAKALTAALSAMILDLSPTTDTSVMLFADSSNPASTSAYRSVGFVQLDHVVTLSGYMVGEPDEAGVYPRRRGASPLEDAEEDKAEAFGPRVSVESFVLWQRKVVNTFGLSFLTLVGMVYFVQGFGSFSALAISYLMKDVLQLQPAASQAIMTTAGFPWAIKPLYGILSDSLPICGYRRKSYLILINLIGMGAYFGLQMAATTTAITHITILILLASLGTAVSDVIIDALVVEMSRLDPKNGANDLQSVTWCMMSLGGIFGSLLAGPATSHLGPARVFLFAMLGPTTILILSILMKEPKAPAVRSAPSCMSTAKNQVNLLKLALRVPVIWKAALFMFASGACAPSYAQVQFYYVTEVLHFSPEFLGNVSALGFVFLMVGTVVYNTFCKHLPFRRIFGYTQIGLAIVSLLEIVLVTRTNLRLGIPDKWFVIGDAMLSDIFGRLKMMPLLVLSSKLCPRGIEGTFFALLMAVANMSGAVSGYWGATLCAVLNIAKDSYENLWIAILLRSALKLFPLTFLFLLPEHDPQEEVEALALQTERSLSSTFPLDDDEIDALESDDLLLKKNDSESI